jgi:hypothetical protein
MHNGNYKMVIAEWKLQSENAQWKLRIGNAQCIVEIAQ